MTITKLAVYQFFSYRPQADNKDS